MNKKMKIREYKNSSRPMGIYQIKNNANGKVLIGASADLPAILNRFKTELKFGSCRNKVLQQEWDHYGPTMFEFNELEILEPDKENPAKNMAKDLQVLEALWLEKLDPFGDKGYNKPRKIA